MPDLGPMNDGHSTIVTFDGDPTIKLWEKTVTPPGFDHGGGIDITTMRTDEWRGFAPKQLKTLTEMTFTAAYSPAVLDSIMAQGGSNQEITVTFPSGATWVFWGFLDKFIPNEMKEGEQPTATVTIVPSNLNNDDPPTEVAPVYTAAV